MHGSGPVKTDRAQRMVRAPHVQKPDQATAMDKLAHSRIRSMLSPKWNLDRNSTREWPSVPSQRLGRSRERRRTSRKVGKRASGCLLFWRFSWPPMPLPPWIGEERPSSSTTRFRGFSVERLSPCSLNDPLTLSRHFVSEESNPVYQKRCPNQALLHKLPTSAARLWNA